MLLASSLPTIYQASLVGSNLLCATVFGEMLVFQTVVMPGIGLLDDKAFLRAFQAMDGLIQRNQPVFVSVWIGSVLTLLTTASLATILNIPRHTFSLWMGTLSYMIGQVSTFTQNVPRNNRLQTLHIAELDDFAAKRERMAFERPWNLWHHLRVVLFGLTVVDLAIVLLQT